MARVRTARPDAVRQFNPGNRAYHRTFNQDYIDAAKPIRQWCAARMGRPRAGRARMPSSRLAARAGSQRRASDRRRAHGTTPTYGFVSSGIDCGANSASGDSTAVESAQDHGPDGIQWLAGLRR